MHKKSAAAIIATICLAFFVVASKFSSFFIMLLPLVLITVFTIDTVAFKWYITTLAAILTIVLSYYMNNDIAMSFILMPIMILAGVFTGGIILKNKSGALAAGITIIATALSFTSIIAYYYFFFDINLVANIFDDMNYVLSQNEFGLDVGFIKDYLAFARNMFVSVMIVSFAIFGYAFAYINSTVFNLLNKDLKYHIGFSRIKADTVTILIYFIVLVLVVFVKDEMLSVVLTNLYIILQFIITVCAVSLIFWFLLKRKTPKIVAGLIAITVLSFSSGVIGSTILTLLALTDARRDIRGLNKNP